MINISLILPVYNLPIGLSNKNFLGSTIMKSTFHLDKIVKSILKTIKMISNILLQRVF